jgi:tRNA dimethylallyltransferase
MDKTLIVLLGATGVGKTELSLRLAEEFNTSILSADSRQLYADLPIGTAAPTPAQLQRVPHHFIGTLQLTDYYSAAQYETDALERLNRLFRDNPVALLTGGSMLYLDAICKGIDEIPTIDAETRELLRHKLDSEGLDSLRAELKLLDPEYYQTVDLKNGKRIVHALEVCYMTGRTFSSFRTRQQKERPFRLLKIGLRRDREELYERINRRVEMMIEDGLIEEARRVFHLRHLNSLNTVGYKEIFNYLDGSWELPFAIEKIKQSTRIYSRKQITWFKRDSEIEWFHPDQEKEIIAHLRKAINR